MFFHMVYNMKTKFYLTAALATALSLSACGGGDSDSSGSYNQSQVSFYETSFRHLPDCTIDRALKTIHIPPLSPRSSLAKECKVKLPELNGGLTFSLDCRFGSKVEIRGERRHIDALKKMVETGKPYTVICPK